MDKSATQRFTNTLVRLGYLNKDPTTRRYRPAVRLPHEKARFEVTIPGRRVPAFCTAGGCVIILSRMPADSCEQILSDSDLRPITPHTICEIDAVRARIETVRQNIHDVGVSQSVVGEISTAAPVFNNEGKVVAAVQIPVYKPEWTVDEVRKKIVLLAMETATAISGSM